MQSTERVIQASKPHYLFQNCRKKKELTTGGKITVTLHLTLEKVNEQEVHRQ